MITTRDLRDRVAEWALRDDVVEKDYVLGWVLSGVGSEPALRDGWVFKGGTCLKKCYLQTFRFSEDLDFTVLPDGPIEEAEVLALLTPLEPVRFAAANRICVDLGYNGSVRRVEPLSLRIASTGALLLYATKQATREIRSYRVDRIQSIQVTTVPFSSTRPVEFSPRGQLYAPPVARRSSSSSSSTPYRVECPQCGKVFRRKKRGTKLNAHNDQSGYPCRARRGHQP